MARRSVAERLDSYVEHSDSCWLWTGTMDSHGYGMMWAEGKVRPAHRIAYELSVGPIPDGLHIDHLCRVRRCVNPAHLEPVTCRTNILRGVGLSAQNARKTHCKHGHPFDERNTYVYRGERYCRTCNTERARLRREKNAKARV